MDKMYSTYADAISDILQERGLSQIWLVREIIKEGQKEESLQQQVSRWLRESAPISEGYQYRINNSLNIKAKQTPNGKWKVRSVPQNDSQEPYESFEREIDKVEEQDLDYLPQLIRLRDKLDEKIRKLTQPKRQAQDKSQDQNGKKDSQED